MNLTFKFSMKITNLNWDKQFIFQLTQYLKDLLLVNHPLVELMQYAESKMEQGPVLVYLSLSEIRMKDADQNVL